jgi:hypothetical protein
VSKAYFTVPFVERELQEFWYQHWEERVSSAKVRNAFEIGALRQVEVVLAHNKREAARLVAQRNPRCVVIESAIVREPRAPGLPRRKKRRAPESLSQ